MVYELAEEEMVDLCRAKVESQGNRAIKYVDALDARAVIPSAGRRYFSMTYSGST